MSILDKKKRARERRATRVRSKVRGTAERPRLSVFRSNRAIWVQLVDDLRGHTLASASSTTWTARAWPRKTWPPRWASSWPSAPRLPASSKVVFDRGPYLYHGRVKALADGAREGGLDF